MTGAERGAAWREKYGNRYGLGTAQCASQSCSYYYLCSRREGGGTKRPTKKPNVFVAVDLSDPQLIDNMKEVLDCAVQFDSW